jgi:hypothetical protein
VFAANVTVGVATSEVAVTVAVESAEVVKNVALPVLAKTDASVPEFAPSRFASATVESVGTVREITPFRVSASKPSRAVPDARKAEMVFVEPTIAVAADALKVGVDAKFAGVAFAGTADKSPNPSEATATADTFFNEIVFTIFLSFSQIRDDLLSGW